MVFTRLLTVITLGLVLVASAPKAQEAKPGPVLSANFHRFPQPLREGHKLAYQAIAQKGAKRIRIPIWWNLYQPRAPIPNGPFEESLNMEYIQWLDQHADYIQSLGMESYFDFIWSPPWSNGFQTKMCGDKPCDFTWYCLEGTLGESDPKCWAMGGWFVERDEDREQFFTYMVQRYSNKGVRSFGACNECLTDPNEIRTFWWGTFEDLLQRFATLKRVVKSIDPTLVLIGDDSGSGPKLHRFLCGGGANLVDKVSIHVYPWPNIQRFIDLLDGFWPNPSRYFEGFKEVMERCAPDKELLITEVGENYNIGIPNFQGDVWNRMLPEIYKRDWIDEYFIFDLVTTSAGNRDSGVFLSDGTPSPAWHNISSYADAHPTLRKAQIDNSLPGLYLSDLDARRGGHNDFILVSNIKNSETPITITLVDSDGDGSKQSLILAPNSRQTLDLGTVPGFNGKLASAAVQPNNAQDIDSIGAEHAAYWGQGWRGGRSAESMMATPEIYLPEGSLGFFTEYITVFNPNPEPISVRSEFLLEGGQEVTKILPVTRGPGRIRIKVNDIPEVTSNHSTVLHGLKLNGDPAPIAAELTMVWGEDEREGHSSPGISEPSSTWYFAEGASSGGDGGFESYLLLANPQNHAVSVVVTYLMDDNRSFEVPISIPARNRYTLRTPESIKGGFGYSVNAQAPILAVRSTYWGKNWEGGSSSIGASKTGTRWLITEGMTGWFTTYALVANPSNQTAVVTLKFLLSGDKTLSFDYHVAPRSRITVNVNGLPGMSNEFFSLEVTSKNNVGIVAERATYWGPNWEGGHAGLARLIH